MGLFGSKSKKLGAAKKLEGTVQFPGDKSISHRYAMLAAIASGESEIHFFSSSADCQSTLNCLKSLGVKIERKENVVKIAGAGLDGLRAPSVTARCGELRLDDPHAFRDTRRATVSLGARGRRIALAPPHEARGRSAHPDGSAHQDGGQGLPAHRN